MRTIVFSGHGSWIPENGYVQMTRNCRIEFYTENARTLSDALGGDLDRGITTGVMPDQRRPGYSSVTNNTLYRPTGLNIRTPDPTTWVVYRHLLDPVPMGGENIQVQIPMSRSAGFTIKQILDRLDPAIRRDDEVRLIWAGCRAVEVTSVQAEYDRLSDIGYLGMKTPPVIPAFNKMQR